MTDDQARRELADRVKMAVVTGAGYAAAATGAAVGDVAQGRIEPARASILEAITEAATAASAVVLASGLRAPASNGDGPDQWYPVRGEEKPR